MTSEERIKQQKLLIETIGRFYDKKGFQPIAGRIIGLLTIMDKEQFTFDEIVEELQISKGSASSALKYLEISGLVEYITLPGDRKRYFQIKKTDRFAIIDDHKSSFKSTVDLLKSAFDLKADKNSRNAAYIRDMIQMINYFIEKLEELKKEYLKDK